MPSVRNVAAEYRVNPLTVLKGYQQLVDEGLVETRRGLGMFINTGARGLLLEGERQKFLSEDWPRIYATIQRLGLNAEDLLTGARPIRRPSSDTARAKPAESTSPKGSGENMACIEAHGLRKAFGTTMALDGIDLRVEEGRVLRAHRSQWRRQDHRSQRDSRPHLLSGRAPCAGARPLERARSPHA